MAYVTLSELKSYLEISDDHHNDHLTRILEAAATDIDSWCGRTFTVTASATRTVRVQNRYRVTIPDATDITTVRTDDNDDGTFETTWSASDYVLEPVDNINADGVTGWPYTSICAVESRTFPTTGRRPHALQLVGSFGWAAVPEEVEQVNLLSAMDRFRQKDAPFGVAGFGEFGPVRIRENRQYQSWLTKYRTAERVALVA